MAFFPRNAKIYVFKSEISKNHLPRNQCIILFLLLYYIISKSDVNSKSLCFIFILFEIYHLTFEPSFRRSKNVHIKIFNSISASFRFLSKHTFSFVQIHLPHDPALGGQARFCLLHHRIVDSVIGRD